MAKLQAKYPYEKEYLQAVHEVLESIEDVYNQHPEFEDAKIVERIVEPLELAATTSGARVMQSAYCLRREMGECLKEHPRLKGDLYLETGGHKYRLEFDCKRCEMNLIDCTK